MMPYARIWDQAFGSAAKHLDDTGTAGPSLYPIRQRGRYTPRNGSCVAALGAATAVRSLDNGAATRLATGMDAMTLLEVLPVTSAYCYQCSGACRC